MNRREFITLLGGAAAWPLAADAQQGERVRRIGVLVGPDENDPVSKTKVSAFTQALAGLGWTDGRNMQIDCKQGGLSRMPGFEILAVNRGLRALGGPGLCSHYAPASTG